MALSFLQSHWAAIVANYTPTQIMLTGNFVVQTLAFWIPSLFYLSIDLTDGHPLGKYKIQPAKKVTAREVLQCLKTVLFNQYLIATPLDISLALLAMHLGRPPALRITADLPSVRETVRDFGISIVVREILFYYSHRLIHIPVLYKRIHKIHHKFTAPIAPSAEYAHPVEHLVSNVLPIIVGPFALHSHIVTFWLFVTFELVETTTVHSGYAFVPFVSRWIRFHDWHHEFFNGCFGAMGWIDAIHGTDVGYKRLYAAKKEEKTKSHRHNRAWLDVE